MPRGRTAGINGREADDGSFALEFPRLTLGYFKYSADGIYMRYATSSALKNIPQGYSTTTLPKMKVEDQSTSPKDEDILSQTQDPLERRRLQNRLSQRNHRKTMP